ncbi:hypothetical protein B9Z19DRAFT_1068577 [Tuber borchii]|uniref:Uncharacterized protein n=1 Tax=Tuber borchii TaxID=42251 RepID=A0A2T6ZER1_TUBBO|nr:hypothetical protein B9Z19DRAFT_1068577 [Tuber borchii]
MPPIELLSALLSTLFRLFIFCCSSIRDLCISYCTTISAFTFDVGTGFALVVLITARTISFSCLCLTSMVSVSPPSTPIPDLKIENYLNRRVELFFSALDNQDSVFELGDERAGE